LESDSQSDSSDDEESENMSENKEKEKITQDGSKKSDEKTISKEEEEPKTIEMKTKKDSNSTALRAAYNKGGFTTLKWGSFYDKGWKPKKDKLTPLFNFSSNDLQADPLVEATKPEFSNHRKNMSKPSATTKESEKEKEVKKIRKRKLVKRSIKASSPAGAFFKRTETKEKVKEDFEQGKSNLLRGWKKLSKSKTKRRTL